jgi:Kef-type K+ transport system membrane component KefB
MSGGGIPYNEVLLLALFLALQWYGARVAKAFKLPTIPVEIGIGLLFGEDGLDLIPEFSHDYSPLQLLGFIGVSLVIFESGMHLNMEKVMTWDMGPHVVTVACLGTALPIVLGLGFMVAVGTPAYPNGLASGFSLAPTSVGISLSLLGQAKQLNTRCGQIIMSAAFLDDIFSIICLVVLINLAKGDFDPLIHVVVPLVASFAFVGFGVFGSYKLPAIMPYFLQTDNVIIKALKVDNKKPNQKDELHLFWMILSFLLLTWLGNVIGSSLLGAFVAGMLFANVPRSHYIWEKQWKRINRWLLRLFFSATVAFSIPVSTLFSVEAFWKGLIIGIFPCLLAKVASGVFVGDERWVVGIAMMARGEFAYLVADTAFQNEQITETQYSIIVWALLWATILTPAIFTYVLKQYTLDQFTKSDNHRSTKLGGDKFSGQKSFLIHYFAPDRVGMVNEMTECLDSLGFDIVKSVTENAGGFSSGTFEVTIKQATTLENRYVEKEKDFMNKTDKLSVRHSAKYLMAADLDDEKLDDICHHLKEVAGDNGVQIIFEPSANTSYEEMIEIHLFGTDHMDAYDNIVDMLGTKMNVKVINKIDKQENGYTTLYCLEKDSEEEEKVIMLSQHIKRPSYLRNISELDCSKFKEGIKEVYKGLSLSDCDARVRIVNADSVVYGKNDNMDTLDDDGSPVTAEKEAKRRRSTNTERLALALSNATKASDIIAASRTETDAVNPV